MSVASTILDNLVAKLKTIKKSGSFSIDVQKVERFQLPIEGEKERQPLISVVPGEDRIVLRDGTNARKYFDIELFIYLASYSNLEEKLQELIDDIYVLIYAPIDLGSNCMATEIINTSDMFISNEQKDGGAIVNIQVIYYASLAAF